jgi:hypothetical protein
MFAASCSAADAIDMRSACLCALDQRQSERPSGDGEPRRT